jgi:hypothetical protein
MSNSKISALTSATTPLAGTETLPIVQSSATTKVLVANLTAGRDVSASGLFVDANSATSAIRITQLGAGNALLVEDSANPDSTPFVITAAGDVGIGMTTPTNKLQIQIPTTAATSATPLVITDGATSTFSVKLFNNVTSIVTGGGGEQFSFEVDGAERMRITATGDVGIGVVAPASKLEIASKTVGNYGANVTINGTSTSKFRIDDLSNASIGRRYLTNNFSRSGPFTADNAAYGVTWIQFDDGFLTFATAPAGTATPVERMRISSGGDITVSTGNVIQGTAAKGFNFTANTPAAGMTSQLLNWYEEGTFTPNQGAGLTLVGAFSSTGRYTRIGRQVSISGTVTGATSVAVTAAGVITSNLPFTVVTAGHGGATNVANNASATVICTSTSVTSAAAIAATATITFSATYFV